MNNSLIYGKNNLEKIVGCEVVDNTLELFIQQPDGSVKSEFKPNKFWMVSNQPFDRHFSRLTGDLFYKYVKYYDTRGSFLSDKKRFREKLTFSIYNEKESAMVHRGFTYFKNLKLEDLSVLSFDIETTGLVHDDTSKVLLIANTVRENGKTFRRMFCYDEYETDGEMFTAWCDWVREIDPSILTGYNILGYDLPYISFCASKAGVSLDLGRDGSPLRFENYTSKFRKDGSQSYEYKKVRCYGREVVDCFFLALKYDVATKKYENYKLKQIIKQEGLEVPGRQFYDAENIRNTYKDLVEWEKIKKYAEHDGDDALAIFDLMAPPYFNLTSFVPKSFQAITEGASGSQINSMMIRAYFQNGHSLPPADSPEEYEGAISSSNPGVYNFCQKADAKSMYPSIILQYKIYDNKKDPQAAMYKLTEYFTNLRLFHKDEAKKTGSKAHADMESTTKIFINSIYGFMGAPGLLFNSPKNAALVTEKGREIITKAKNFVENNGFSICNIDTDGIIFTDGQHLDEQLRKDFFIELNNQFPSFIRFADDGYFKSMLVVKTKNYVLVNFDEEVKIKGAALKMPMKEKAIQEFGAKFMEILMS